MSHVSVYIGVIRNFQVVVSLSMFHFTNKFQHQQCHFVFETVASIFGPINGHVNKHNVAHGCYNGQKRTGNLTEIGGPK